MTSMFTSRCKCGYKNCHSQLYSVGRDKVLPQNCGMGFLGIELEVSTIAH